MAVGVGRLVYNHSLSDGELNMDYTDLLILKGEKAQA